MPNILHPSQLPLRKGSDPVFAKCAKTNVVACTWHDVKRVSFLSTVHTNAIVTKNVRSGKHAGGFRQVTKPRLAEDYNQYMGGVDTMDQMLGTYTFPHKMTKCHGPDAGDLHLSPQNDKVVPHHLPQGKGSGPHQWVYHIQQVSGQASASPHLQGTSD